jgi:nickel transport protein
MKILFFISLLGLSSLPARAHDLQTSVTHSNAVAVRVLYPDNRPFAYENYEVYAPGADKIPYQSGYTDAQGTVAFLPASAGQWRIKAMSSDGHGVDMNIEIAPDKTVVIEPKTPFDRFAKLITGVSLIFGLAGAASLFARRRKE